MDAALPLRVRDEVVVADLTRGLPVEDFSIVVRLLGAVSAERFTGASLEVVHGGFFDTLVVRVPSHAHEVVAKAASERRPPSGLLRAWSYVTPVVSNCHHFESGMLRYLRSPSQKDYAADRGMISLGSCPPPEAFAS